MQHRRQGCLYASSSPSLTPSNLSVAELANGCKDVRLRNALLAYAAPIKSFAVQMKILTAVKASTSEDDPSTKQQLVTCAKGIASAVVSSCKAAESCLVVAKDMRV